MPSKKAKAKRGPNDGTRGPKVGDRAKKAAVGLTSVLTMFQPRRSITEAAPVQDQGSSAADGQAVVGGAGDGGSAPVGAVVGGGAGDGGDDGFTVPRAVHVLVDNGLTLTARIIDQEVLKKLNTNWYHYKPLTEYGVPEDQEVAIKWDVAGTEAYCQAKFLKRR